MPTFEISDKLPLDTVIGIEIIHTKGPARVDSTMTAFQVGGLIPPPVDFFPVFPLVLEEEDALVILQDDEEFSLSIPQFRTLLGGTDYLGENQDWIDTFEPPGPSQDDINFFRTNTDPQDASAYIQGEHDLGGLQFRFGRYRRQTDKAEKITFRNPFPNKCVSCHIVVHRDIHPDDEQQPMNVSTFEKDHFWMNRSNGVFGLTLVATSWLAIGF